jgi:tricorn protease
VLRSFIPCFALSLSATLAAAVEAELPRHPAPSPDGTVIAFSWQGDLWVVPATGGDARRLTAHPAVERSPVWSRDGAWIAFASDRYGNDDVFVMPVDGSAGPRRLTFASVDDTPVDFALDGTRVLFVSNRYRGIRWMPQLWWAPVAGGTPILAQDAFGQSAAVSPDGAATVFVRGATRWTRRGYRGAANRDLWLRTADGAHVQLTTFDGDDDDPSFLDERRVAFRSARSGRKNVYVHDLVGGDATQLTFHDGTDVRFPRAAADGSVIAYEYEDAIWTVVPGGDGPSRLAIDVPADDLRNPVERRSDRDGASDLAVSPDGELVAFIVHGDVFVTGVRSKDDQEIAKPPTVRVTSTPERERDVVWTPDGSRLAFASERDGAADLLTVRPEDPDVSWLESFEFTVEPLVVGPEEDRLPRFSPDRSKVAFLRGNGDLMVASADGSGTRTLVEHFYAPDFRWSPDGAWIAYSLEDMDANSDIWIISADGGEPYNVSRHPDYDVQPTWSPDGRRLVWTSRRHGTDLDLWSVWLSRADAERSPEQWLQVFNGGDEPESDDDDDSGDEDASDAPELPEVVIDFDRLWERAEMLVSLQGDEGRPLVTPDGKRVLFTATDEEDVDLWSVRFDGEDVTRLTTGGRQPTDLQFGPDGKDLFYLDGDGTVRRTAVDGTDGDPVPFTARYDVDLRAERAAVFDEVWRALDANFYDPDFHGVDWPAQREIYRPWALAASHDADFSDVVNLMLGELNASHMGYYPRGRGEQPVGEQTGWIGVVFDAEDPGPGVLIAEVLPDSPAARIDVGLEAGDRLLAVGGREIATDTNVFELFADTIGERVPIAFRTADGSQRRAVVVPESGTAQRRLRYEQWVRERRALVDEWSGGRLGYIHVQGMNIPSFEEFERGLYAAAHDREGLVIDVRSNGGGWTTDYLMTVLSVRRHAYTVPRGANPDARAYPTAERLPLGTAWTRPAAALCNEDSYSNAEIFSHAFRTLGRGPLVGSPTFGAVISTGGTRLLNGGWVRLPFRGWYVAGSDVNMEKQGAQPDVVVWQPPSEDGAHAEDTQLARTVEVLLSGLASDPRAGQW